MNVFRHSRLKDHCATEFKSLYEICVLEMYWKVMMMIRELVLHLIVALVIGCMALHGRKRKHYVRSATGARRCTILVVMETIGELVQWFRQAETIKRTSSAMNLAHVVSFNIHKVSMKQNFFTLFTESHFKLGKEKKIHVF